jgi:hypothetical protein
MRVEDMLESALQCAAKILLLHSSGRLAQSVVLSSSITSYVSRAWMQCYGTAQRTDFSLSAWYRPQAVQQGCRFSWLDDVARLRSFRVSSY